MSPVGIQERTEEQNIGKICFRAVRIPHHGKAEDIQEVDWPILVIGPVLGLLRNVAGVDRMLAEALVSRGVVNKHKLHTHPRGKDTRQ